MKLMKNHTTWYTAGGVLLILKAFVTDHCSVTPMDMVDLVSQVAPAVFLLVAGFLHGKSKQIQQVAQVAENLANEAK